MLEMRKKVDGTLITNCLMCDKILDAGHNEFECTHPITGNHRFDVLRQDADTLIHFPEWCPLLKTEVL